MKKHWVALMRFETAVQSQILHALKPERRRRGKRFDYERAVNDLLALLEKLKLALPASAALRLPNLLRLARGVIRTRQTPEPKTEALRRVFHATWEYLNAPHFTPYFDTYFARQRR